MGNRKALVRGLVLVMALLIPVIVQAQGGPPRGVGNDTNAATLCDPGEYLDGNGDCIAIPTDTLSELDCVNNEIPKFNGALWECSAVVDTVQYVPFQATSQTTGVCDVPGGGEDRDRIEIDSAAATGDFMVTSILFVASAANGGVVNFRELQVDGVSFIVAGASGKNLIGNFAGSVLGFEVLGEILSTGAFVPRQITATSSGSPDIIVFLACQADGQNIEFPAGSIVVSGWKQASDTITVIYNE